MESDQQNGHYHGSMFISYIKWGQIGLLKLILDVRNFAICPYVSFHCSRKPSTAEKRTKNKRIGVSTCVFLRPRWDSNGMALIVISSR